METEYNKCWQQYLEILEMERERKLKKLCSKPKKRKFNFKVYYDSNPEFRARHLANMKTRVLCQCGKSYIVAHKSRHIKTRHHLGFRQIKPNLKLEV